MSQAHAIHSGLKPSNGPVATNPPADIKLPRGALLALSVSAFGSGISMRVSDPLLPGIAKEFSLTLGHAALVITVFAIAYGFSQLIFGPLGERSLGKPATTSYNLVRSYQIEVDRQHKMVLKAEHAHQRLLLVVQGLKALFTSENFGNLLRAEGLDTMPKYLSDRLSRHEGETA